MAVLKRMSDWERSVVVAGEWERVEIAVELDICTSND